MKKIVSLLIIVLTLVGCTSNNNNSDNAADSYDRTTLLTNWADNIIIPAYTNYQSKTQVLVESTNTFTTTPTESNLQIMRASWAEAYKAFQTVMMYNFGKAEQIYIREKANTYPTDIAGINTNIASGTYNFALLSQFSKQGFPALDYLINGLGNSDGEILEFYTTNAQAANYKKYITDLSNNLKSTIDLVVTDWNSGYRNTYISNKDNTTSGSVNVTINNFIKSIEKDIRAGKVGIPCGIFSTGTLFPEKVEAYYKNDISKELLNVSVQANMDFFNGKHFGKTTSGESLKSYLDHLNATKNGQKLSDIINNQYSSIFTTNDALSNSLSQQVNSDNSKMLNSYDSLQQLVVFTKIDMMQALKINIDYVDSDGD
ncbi:MAG: imelysin family protein [Flavobacterium sp.]